MNEPQLPATSVASAIRHELEAIRHEWWWFLALGIGMVLLGTVAIASAPFFTIVTVMFFGFLLLAAGLAQIVSSFWAGKWSGFLLHLLVGILYAVAGYLIVDAPVAGAAALSLLIAAMLIVNGIFRITAALSVRFSNWGWSLLSGVVSVLLGLFIYKKFPDEGWMIIGIFIGIELIFNGWAWVMLALTLQRLPKTTP